MGTIQIKKVEKTVTTGNSGGGSNTGGNTGGNNGGGEEGEPDEN